MTLILNTHEFNYQFDQWVMRTYDKSAIAARRWWTPAIHRTQLFFAVVVDSQYKYVGRVDTGVLGPPGQLRKRTTVKRRQYRNADRFNG